MHSHSLRRVTRSGAYMGDALGTQSLMRVQGYVARRRCRLFCSPVQRGRGGGLQVRTSFAYGCVGAEGELEDTRRAGEMRLLPSLDLWWELRQRGNRLRIMMAGRSAHHDD